MSLTQIDRQVNYQAEGVGGEHERAEYFVTERSDPHRNLLIAVLHRAIMDLRPAVIQMSSKEDRRTAVRWFKSKSKKEWTFIWVCAHLDLDPKFTKEAAFAWVRMTKEELPLKEAA